MRWKPHDKIWVHDCEYCGEAEVIDYCYCLTGVNPNQLVAKCKTEKGADILKIVFECHTYPIKKMSDKWTVDYTSYKSPGIPAFTLPLPTPLHIGRKVKMKGEYKGGINTIGIVENHYICSDDCSGWYGKHLYVVSLNGERKTVKVEDCELMKEIDWDNIVSIGWDASDRKTIKYRINDQECSENEYKAAAIYQAIKEAQHQLEEATKQFQIIKNNL